MRSSVMLRHVALVRTDVSVECNASIMRVTGISELGATLSVPATEARSKEILISQSASVASC
jgi:hypothetical protein